ncbi:N-acetylmuramoyl-L-alanine amidase-like domain-containing protein [Mariniphaga sp.]|uniref:N-acetylmuramoyl-L-alanine amidase-like domain-containing protein n=1 Tax=Mariniphaga sp. TaxID=1954475 RepID=UPI00356A9703
MRILILSVFYFLLTSCTFKGNVETEEFKTISTEEDKEIVEQIFELFADEKGSPTSVLMVKLGTYFMETPYVAHTLEKGDEEQLVVNLRGLDCTTLVENCLALTKTIQSGEHTFEQFTKELKNVRYRSGKIDGYPSRLHYTTDWIFDNQQKKLVRNLSKEIGATPYPKEINFMSTHPDSYRQLKDSSHLVEIIAQKERDINSRQHFYIPEEKLAEVEDQLMDGDIVGITTSIEGLDISHMGILIRKGGRIHLLHASSAAEKVVLSEETLEEYLLSSKSATGIMVARPL